MTLRAGALEKGPRTVWCVYWSTGRLQPARLTVTFTYFGNLYPLVDPDGLQCDDCGEPFISPHVAAVLSADIMDT